MIDPVWYGCVLSSHGESRAKYNLAEPILLQVEHVAVELIVQPFRPSGPFLRTMKISAQLCHVDTSYFTHNWGNGGGRERLIPSRTGPKDLPLPQPWVTAEILDLCDGRRELRKKRFEPEGS